MYSEESKDISNRPKIDYPIEFQEHLWVMTVNDYINANSDKHPELIDYTQLDVQNDFTNDFKLEELKSDQSLYEPHKKLEEVLLNKGKYWSILIFIDKQETKNYFTGRLQVSRFDITEATVKINGVYNDVMVKGKQELNRGLNMDTVIVEILPETQWIEKGISTDAIVTDILEKDETKVEIEGKEDELNQKELNIIQRINESEKQPMARVIGIVKRMYKTYAGETVPYEELEQKHKDLLQDFDCEKFNQNYRLFVPFDVRMDKIVIKSSRPEYLDKKRIIVKVDGWDDKFPFPYGHVVKILGDKGDSNTESAVILHEFNVDNRPFSNKVLSCLPQEDSKWTISSEEEAKRLDLRGLNIWSIDPPGCKDIDDALHCLILPNGNYQVGVHIADVTHFVRPDTEIDKEAARRCTTVYLVEKRTDMLPGLLTENLCSLRCKVDRLAFSVLWEINSKTFEIEHVDFHKTIIHSVASLTYQDAQGMIDDKRDKSELTQGIRNLMKIATKLRKRRNDAGALTLASPEVRFKLEQETLNPTDVALYQHKNTNYLVEEFMLLANVAVATKIVDAYPAYSVLRRHESPKTKELQEFSKLLGRFGFDIKSESSKSLAESLDLAKRENDDVFNKVVRILVTRCMNQALYFNTADFEKADFHHYGLAAPLYTHFTSPIRRYADVLVHRLLAASLDLYSLPNQMTDKEQVSKQCDHMNRKNRMAALASRASASFYTYKFFKGKEDEIERAMVIKVSNAGVHVIILKYGIEGLLEHVPGKVEIVPDPENEQAMINNEIIIKTFGHWNVNVVSQTIEYRKSLAIKFIEIIDTD